MTTVLDLVNATKRQLHGAVNDDRNLLTNPVDDNDTTITLTYELSTIRQRGRIAIEDEILYVWEIDPTSKTAIVERGLDGSTAAAHSAGAIVEANPRFSRFAIVEALRDEINSYGPKLYQVATVDVVTTTTTLSSDAGRGYDLTGVTDVYGVLAVNRQADITGDTNWPQVRNWRLARNMPLASFASGNALFIYSEPTISSGLTVRVTYATSFDTIPFDLTTDVVADVGLPQSATDIPPYGAAWRLMVGREVSRTFGEGQSEPRNATEVPPGAAMNASRVLLDIRTRRLEEEHRKLLATYPPVGF